MKWGCAFCDIPLYLHQYYRQYLPSVKLLFVVRQTTIFVFVLSTYKLRFYFFIDVAEVILDNLIDCSFDFQIVFFFRKLI